MEAKDRASGRLLAAAIEDGCLVRVEGRGTMRLSAAARGVALRTLHGSDTARVVFDLSGCDYLDSTFLGCLLELCREGNRSKPPRFFVAATPERRKKLLSACRLDAVFPPLDAPPAVDGQFVEIPADDADDKALAQHVLECHRALAEVDGPMRATFQRIVAQLEREAAAK